MAASFIFDPLRLSDVDELTSSFPRDVSVVYVSVHHDMDIGIRVEREHARETF